MDRWVLEIIQSSYMIEFVSPHHHKPPTRRVFRDHYHKEVPPFGGRLSSLARNYRACATLTSRERILVHIFFSSQEKWRMETSSQSTPTESLFLKIKILHGLIGINNPLSGGEGSWFEALGMKDAYFHVDIHPSHRRFLRFLFGRTASSSDSFHLG